MMNDYIRQLKESIDFALQMGSFNHCNIIENTKNVCVFGLGKYFEEAFVQQKVAERFKVTILCDNNKNKLDELSMRGGGWKQFQYLTPEELPKDTVVIIMLGNPGQVEEQLNRLNIKHMTYNDLSLNAIMGVPKEKKWFSEQADKIIEAYNSFSDIESKKIYTNVISLRIAPHLARMNYRELFSEGEYFGHGLFSLSQNENFIDCGTYTGTSINEFLQATNEKFSSIIGFELDKDNFLQAEKFLGTLKQELQIKIKVFNYGVWNQNELMMYGKGAENEPSGGISLFKTQNPVEGRVVRLEDIAECRSASFIKMDIEGAELKALIGAKRILKENKPKLAICVYHCLNDLWEVPIFIRKISKDYKISIRHHWPMNMIGTVCYASIK